MDRAGGAQRPVFVLMNLKSRVRRAHVRARAAKSHKLFNIFLFVIYKLSMTINGYVNRI
jgi:hypothetical protein